MATTLAACIAIAAPALLAYNMPPSATFLNQAAALLGWGAFCWVLVLLAGDARQVFTPGLTALAGAFAALLAAAAAAPLWSGLPWSLALSNLGMLSAALLAACVGAQLQSAGRAEPVFRALCIGMVVAGVASSAIGIVQVLWPQWADGGVIARSGLEGRAVGNVRQPNHLSSLLLWAFVAALWLGETRAIRRGLSAACALLFVFVIVLSGSRTGALSVVLLAIWGVVDKRLSRLARGCLVIAPLAYAVFWFGTSAWADYSHHVFGAETRFSTQGDISSSRYAIWSNTLALTAAHPWFGVGFGEFNFAWTMTPFPDRPVAFFDHTHNLVLQLAVELGIPLATLVTSLLLWSIGRALQKALSNQTSRDPAQSLLRRCAVAMLVLILVHSLLEYPLWYAYFLLPTAFLFGLCLADAGGPPKGQTGKPERTRPIFLASMLMTFCALASLADYLRVVVIFTPPRTAAPLSERIADGQRSILFSHHADYAAATTAEHPSTVMSAFDGATHYLLDARLMQAWAVALAESGDVDRARYVAARLREFRNDQAEPFFAVCDEPRPPGAEAPFQCEAPARIYSYRDFR